jgi:hypothetical protein
MLSEWSKITELGYICATTATASFKVTYHVEEKVRKCAFTVL